MRDYPQIGVPIAGLYRMRLAKGALAVPVRIWFGQPVIAGEVQDRTLRWCAEVDGECDKAVVDDNATVIGREPIDAFDVWPLCCGSPIDDAEYRFLLKRKAWAVVHKPDHPAATPRKRIDIRKLEPGW